MKHQACRTVLVVTFIASLIIFALPIGALDAFPTPQGALFQKGVGTISPFLGGPPIPATYLPIYLLITR